MLEFFNRFARLASARSEVVGATLIVIMITMMVIPLNPWILDALLAINISICTLLVISAMLIQTPLSFSSFPAVLLMTTLFRLALTISTTRQILLEADAGHIIQTFGEFVVGGNLAVGLVIFLIISVVNFLVVTKGSERVAEVAARFSLDAMPGKQMSIDSDLRAGLINQATAKSRRSDLEKESQLFGAMDGAIKFVKNDAIAGLVITLVNLVGGLAVGMLQKDMTFSSAGHVYSILSIGDGLVAIIPSLMVSIAAGLIVTRVTKGEADGANTAQDMIRDLSRNTTALQISGVICLLFSIVPGMPTTVFIFTSIGFFCAWYFLQNWKENPSGAEPSSQDTKLFDERRSSQLQDITSTTTFAEIEVRIPKQLDPAQANMIRNICRLARNRLIDQSGVMLPLIEFTEHGGEFVDIHVYGVPSLEIDPQQKDMSIWVTPDHQDVLNGLTYRYVKDAITGRLDCLCEPVLKPELDGRGLSYITYENRLTMRVEALLTRKIAQLFTLNEYQKHITSLGEKYAEQLKELERVLPSTKVVEVLQKLLVESVSLKNMRSILNSLIEWGQRERDPIVITEQVRRGLFEQICHHHLQNKRLKVMTLSLDYEQIIRESSRNNGISSFLDIDAASLNRLVEMVESQLKPHLSAEQLPVIITSMDCRAFFRQIIQDSLFSVAVLSHHEIAPNIDIEVVGEIGVDRSFQMDSLVQGVIQ